MDEIEFKCAFTTNPVTRCPAMDEAEELRKQLAAVSAERDAAVSFIKYLDYNYSNYISEDEKFKLWRGKEHD